LIMQSPLPAVLFESILIGVNLINGTQSKAKQSSHIMAHIDWKGRHPNSYPQAERRAILLSALRQIVSEKMGFFIEKDFTTTKSRMEFTCADGHKWKTTASQIIMGSWCRQCFNKSKAGKHLLVDRIPDAHRIAAERGGSCLSKKWVNSAEKLDWQCANNHNWKATYHDIKKGTWCPLCGKGVRERLCRHYFEQLTGYDFPSAKPSWLVNANKNRMELDGFCEALSLAFEHQGQQHYQEVDHFSRRHESFEWRRASDQLKRDLCSHRNITLIEVPYWIENSALPAWISEEIGTARPDITLQSMLLPLDYLASNELKELQQMAASKGGECLSPAYFGIDKHHLFRCGEGHLWEATPSAILNSRGVGTWCPDCKSKRISESKRLYTVKDMQEFAESKGGKFLSNEFLNVNQSYLWECSKGHTWLAAPADVLRRTWCSKCAQNAKKHSIEVAIELAENRNGKCISSKDDYVNSYSYLHWECQKGHKWWARYNNVKNLGAWCPQCSGRKPKFTDRPG
jgi:hypothetical protein